MLYSLGRAKRTCENIWSSRTCEDLEFVLDIGFWSGAGPTEIIKIVISSGRAAQTTRICAVEESLDLVLVDIRNTACKNFQFSSSAAGDSLAHVRQIALVVAAGS